MAAVVTQSRRRQLPHGAGGFTLAELLIVIGIIALVAILAIPALRAMTGSRSTEAAHNQLSALLGRTRSEAIALQEIRGVAFFQDPDTKRVQAVMVKAAQYPSSPPARTPAALPSPALYLDYVPERDVVLLPDGVGLQTMDDYAPDATGKLRLDDGYLGLNIANKGAGPTGDGTGLVNGVQFVYGGAILFDGFGRLVTKQYGFKFFVEDGTGAKVGLTNLAKAWNVSLAPTAVVDFIPPGVIRSQLAFLLFDNEVFTEQEFDSGDPQLNNSLSAYADLGQASIGEAKEERWLDVNGTAEYVNRYNGTLIRGQ